MIILLNSVGLDDIALSSRASPVQDVREAGIDFVALDAIKTVLEQAEVLLREVAM